MKIDRLFAVTVVLVSAVLAGCGSSDDGSTDGSTGSGSGTTDVACTFTTAGAMSCTSYGNLSSAQVDSVKQICSSEPGGMEVDSCPTDNLLGCCDQTVSGFDTNTCYYESNGLTADSLKMSCMQGGGTWSTTP